MNLRNQIDEADYVDKELLELVRDLENKIEAILDTAINSEPQSTSELALDLESRFEANYPAAAVLVREVLNTLNKMGI